MAKLTFSTWQRVRVLGVVAAKQRPDNATLNRAMHIIDALEFTDEETARAGLQFDGVQYAWSKDAPEWEKEFSTKQIAMLTEDVKPENAHWNAAEARQLKSLFKQLGIDVGGEEDE